MNALQIIQLCSLGADVLAKVAQAIKGFSDKNGSFTDEEKAVIDQDIASIKQRATELLGE
jgi:hypothetical protein